MTLNIQIPSCGRQGTCMDNWAKLQTMRIFLEFGRILPLHQRLSSIHLTYQCGVTQATRHTHNNTAVRVCGEEDRMGFSSPSSLQGDTWVASWPSLRPRHTRFAAVSSYPPWPDSGSLQSSIPPSFTATASVSCCFKYFFTALWSIASLMNKGLPSVHRRAIAQPGTKLSVITGTGKLNRAALKAALNLPGY